MSVAYSITSSKQFESYTVLRVSLGLVRCIRNDDDDVTDGTDDDDDNDDDDVRALLAIGYTTYRERLEI